MKEERKITVISLEKIDSLDEIKYSLDDAIKLTDYGSFHKMTFLLCGSIMVGATIENISGSFILPYANCELHMTTVELGLFSSVPFIGIVCSSHLWGFLADTCGRLKVMRYATFFAFLSSFVSAFMTNTLYWMIARFFVGVFISGLQASIFSYVSEFFVKETSARATSLLSMFMPANFIVASTIGMILIPMDWRIDAYFLILSPWRLFVIIVCLTNLFNFIACTLLMSESPKFLLAVGKTDETLHVLQRMYSINTKQPRDTYPVKYLIPEASGSTLSATKGFSSILKLIWYQTKPIFVAPYLDTTVKLCYMIFILYFIGHGTFLWFPDFMVQLQNRNNSSDTLCEVVGHERIEQDDGNSCDIDNKNTLAFKMLFLIGAIFTCMSGLISFYMDKVGPRRLVLIWLTLSAICCVALNYIAELYSIVSAFIIFVSSSLCAAIIMGMSVSLYPTKVRAMATCFIFMCGRVGGLAGANFVGFLLEHHCSLIFNISSFFVLSSGGVFLLIKNGSNQKTKTPSES